MIARVFRPWTAGLNMESGSGPAARTGVGSHEVLTALASGCAGQVEAIWPLLPRNLRRDD
jgi:hypothetical protein